MANEDFKGKLPGLISSEGFDIDGMSPKAVAAPCNLEDIVRILKFAHAGKNAVIPWGGGTSIGLGMPLKKYDIALSLKKFNAVLEYEPADMTCSVQAGITIRELNRILGEHSLFLPLDPPLAGKTTIGGVTAANINGPLRHQYGMIKDQILGMKMVLCDGTIVKSGGKVVKNVAGYDVHKLFIGSLGTLGIITQVNLRLRPVPSIQKTVLLGFDSIPSASEAAAEIIQSYLTPEFMVMCCRGTLKRLADKSAISVPDGTTGIIVGVDGHPKNAKWQVKRIQELMDGKNLTSMSIIENEKQNILRSAFRDYPETFNPELVVKVSFLLSNFIDLYHKQKKLQEELHNTAYLMIYPGTGTMLLMYNSIDGLEDIEKDKYVNFLKEEIKIVIENQGTITLERAPLWVKQRVYKGGILPDSFNLMRSIKMGLDPNNIMSPGRFNDGL